MSDVGFLQARCRILQVRCRILTSRMSDFYKSDVGCRILTSRMSNFYKSHVECRIFKVGCRMAPISFRTIELTIPTFKRQYPARIYGNPFKDDFQSVLRSLSSYCLCASLERNAKNVHIAQTKWRSPLYQARGCCPSLKIGAFYPMKKKKTGEKLYVPEGILRGSICWTVSSAGVICAIIWVCRRTKTWQSSLWTSTSLHKKRIALGKIYFEDIFIYHFSHYSKIQ